MDVTRFNVHRNYYEELGVREGASDQKILDGLNRPGTDRYSHASQCPRSDQKTGSAAAGIEYGSADFHQPQDARLAMLTLRVFLNLCDWMPHKWSCFGARYEVDCRAFWEAFLVSWLVVCGPRSLTFPSSQS